MIKALAKFDKKSRQQILAKFAGNFLPNPTESLETVSSLDKVESEILKEVLSKLRVAYGEITPEVRSLILSFITRELTDMAIEKSDFPEIRGRLGTQGILPIGLYDLTYTAQFVQLCLPMGVTRDEVASAIRRSLLTNHLVADDFSSQSTRQISLFVDSRERTDPYSLLVICLRAGFKLHVFGAWKIFRQELDLSKAREATDVLATFCEMYGIPMSLGDEESKSKLWLNQKRFVGWEMAASQSIRAHPPKDVVYDTNFIVHKSTAFIEVALAFTLNVSMFVESLKKHGVDVKRDLTLGGSSLFLNNYE